jgi:cytochrome c peroxidase
MRFFWLVFFAALTPACSGGANQATTSSTPAGDAAAPGATDAGLDAGEDPDPDPVVTPTERSTLASLRYDDAPAPADASNKLADDPAARLFGQRLFFDTSMSGPLIEPDNDGSDVTLGTVGQPGRVSCAGCHIPSSGFVDTRSRGKQISLAAEWGIRRTPTLLEIAFAPLDGWDGRRDSNFRQAVAVMENEREFNAGRLFVAEQMFRLHKAEYEALFGPLPPLDDASRFPALAPADAGCVELVSASGAKLKCRGKPGDGADYDAMAPADQELVTRVAVNAGKALGAYVRQLRCGAGRFDAWLGGDTTAMSRAEIRGAALFAGRAGCATCHTGPRLSDERYHDVGLAPQTVAIAFIDDNDRGAIDGIAAAIADPLNTKGPMSDGYDGRLPDHVGPELEGAFRTPTLRCVSSRPSFMHTGQLRSLDDVVAFFDAGGSSAGYPGTNEIHAIGLTDRERNDLIAFLKALDGPGPDAALTAPLP